MHFMSSSKGKLGRPQFPSKIANTNLCVHGKSLQLCPVNFNTNLCVHGKSLQLCPVNFSPSGSSVHGILQA